MSVLEGLWFMHLHPTAITRSAESGREISEIAAITGHSIRAVETIVDRCLVRTSKLVRAASTKRLAGAAR